jgi:hypothetical protein
MGKKKKSSEQLKKEWRKSLRIWKKINSRIRLTKIDGYYYIETRSEGKGDWEQSPSYSSAKRAIRMKHNHTQRIIRDLGYQPFFKERRVQRMREKQLA